VSLPSSGLRDRKKAATRAALAEAAAELAREHGVHAVTADAIAARAGVSTRTFHNYFASKEEAVFVHLERVIEEWIEMLRQRPADEHILDSLRECAVGLVTDPKWSFDEIGACVSVVEESSALLVRGIEVERRSTRMLIDVIAERTGTDPGVELFPNLIHHVALGAIKAAIEMHLAGVGRSPEDLIRDAFGRLRLGFP
jgi:AcrR family transcriptional regulator